MITDEGKHYLYRHITLDTEELFYIGIGTKKKENYQCYKEEFRRAFTDSKRSSFWRKISVKHGWKVEIVLQSDDYSFIKEKEKEFIKLHGRRDLKTGILCNLTDGGEGLKGVVRTNEWSNKISESNKGISRRKGYTMAEEVKVKIRASNVGKKRSDITKKRVKDSRQRQDMSHKWKAVLQYDLNGSFIQEHHSLDKAAKYLKHRHGFNISLVCKGKRRQCGGFIWKYKNAS